MALLPLGVMAQTVTTFLDASNADVDDAMALDSQGNLYGSTFYGGAVYKISPDGTAIPFVTGLAWANGLAVDSEDNVFVAEYLNASINKYDPQGNLIEKLSIGSGYPSGLIKSYKSDNMIYTDVGDNSINEMDANGTVTTLYQGAPLNIPVGLAYGPGGDLYIGNYIGREIYRLPAGGTELEYVATVPAPSGHVPYLAFITYAQGFLYGTVYGEHKIYQIDPRNTDDVEIYSGSSYGKDDGPIHEATYGYPAGILANKSGNILYVSEFDGYGNIRKITNGNGIGNKNAQHRSAFESYPNPAKEYINIVRSSVNNSENNVSIRLYDIISGMLVLEKKEVKIVSSYSLSIEGVKAGLYEMVISNDTVHFTKTVVVSN